MLALALRAQETAGLDQEILLWCVAIGFAAQLVDGALGMAYGVVSTTALLAFGVPPAVASATVHSAELFTTAASGTSHAIARNVDWKLFRRLAPAGMIGGAIGALVLSKVDLDWMKTVIAAYLLGMGVIVLRRAFVERPHREMPHRVGWLGFAGGFADAVGGGGWGPVVSSNLIARGGESIRVVGTVNITEFLITMAISATFIATIGLHFGAMALGLIIGGVVAAPIAAFGARKLPRKTLTALVGLAIIAVSTYNLWRYLT